MAGVPSCQRTVAFEKAYVLFNIGVLNKKIGTRQEGLDTAVNNFLRAAGTFQYIHENFANAPSMDLGPENLHMLVQLIRRTSRNLHRLRRDRRLLVISIDLKKSTFEMMNLNLKKKKVG